MLHKIEETSDNRVSCNQNSETEGGLIDRKPSRVLTEFKKLMSSVSQKRAIIQLKLVKQFYAHPHRKLYFRLRELSLQFIITLNRFCNYKHVVNVFCLKT